jgi:hypothetical protein
MPENTPDGTATPEQTQPISETKTETVETTQPVETAKPSEKRKYKYKVDGEELEEEVTDDDIIKALQLSKAAPKRFKEAADTRDKMLRLYEEGKKNPLELLKTLGVNPREFAERYLYEIYKEEELPEPDRKRIEAERKAADAEGKLKEYEEKQLAEQQALETEKYRQDYDMQIASALEKASLPRLPQTVKRVASYLIKGIEKGIDIPIDKVIELVREDYENEFKELYGKADEDTIKRVLGDEKAKALAKKIASETSEQRPENRAEGVEPSQSSRSSKRKTWKEFEKELDAAIGK